MRIYLTGGAIRDELLEQSPCDRDYIVLDASVEELINKGYQRVGNSYDVFLHPKSKDEYVLAVENNLDKELERRDLTINSMAKDIETNEIYDPFNGRGDIESKTLRHTSLFFKDDPIRVFRIARFLCSLKDFKIAKETDDYIQSLLKNKDYFKDIPPERFYNEFKKLFKLNSASQFLRQLSLWDLLKVIGLNLSKTEVDDLISELDKAFLRTDSYKLRMMKFLILLKSEKRVLSFCERVAIEKHPKSIACLMVKVEKELRVWKTLEAKRILELLTLIGAFKQGETFKDVITLMEDSSLVALKERIEKLDTKQISSKYQGELIGQKIKELRVREISLFLESK